MGARLGAGPLLALMALLLSAVPGQALAAGNSQLKTCRDSFEYGNYEESGRLAEALLLTRDQLAEDQQIEAYKIAGLSHFYLNNVDAARRSFVGLLSVDPDYALDPFLVPPAAVAFFDGVKRDKEAYLAPIRERRKARDEQQRLEEEARRRLLEESLRRQGEPDKPVLIVHEIKRTFIVNLLPFGAGQFQEERPVVGGLVAGGQAISLVGSIACFVNIENLRSQFGKYSKANYDTAQSYNTLKWVSLSVFAATYVGGVLDSLWHYQGSESRIEALQQPVQRLGGPSPSSTTPSTTPNDATKPSSDQTAPKTNGTPPSTSPTNPMNSTTPATNPTVPPSTPDRSHQPHSSITPELSPWIGADSAGVVLGFRF
jgi:hypothetical protein